MLKINYVWQPTIRTTLVADDGREFENLYWIEWMDTLTETQQRPIWETSHLNRRQCRALWRYLGRTDKAPKRLGVLINSEDLLRIFPETGTR